MEPVIYLAGGIAAAALLLVALVACICRRRRASAARELTLDLSDEGDEEQPARPRKVVAVVGGGMSGLVSSRRFLAEGMDIVGFERSDSLGGLWIFRDGEDGKTYRSLRANVHKERLQMEDFPMPESWPRYPSHWQLGEYLRAFAKHFDLEKRYKMQTEVVNCQCTPEGSWMLTYKPVGADDSEKNTIWVDAVCMCVGQACEPTAPTYPGQESFQGEILHTVQYRGQVPFHGKRVMVVGAGAASGTDIAQDLSFGAQQTFLSVRKGIILLPRFLGGRPNAEWFERNIWSYVPLAWMWRLITISVNMMTAETFGTGSAERRGIKGPSVMDTLRTRLDELRISDMTSTDCCNLTQRVAMGAIKMKPEIECFLPTGVRFVDGTVEELDAVIWATGFKRNITGLGCDIGRRPMDGEDADAAESARGIRLWRCLFHPSLPNFACCLQTHPYGSHWAVADMEAKWISGVFSGRLSLPERKQMEREAAEVAEHQSRDTCLDWTRIEEVAKLMGQPRPGACRILALLATKPVRTWRWLQLPKTTRKLTVDECAEPTNFTCKYKTSL